MSERLISHGVLVFWLVARLLLRGSKCFYVVAKVFWVVARWSLKGGVSDFWSPMLTFEITKTNTPLPQKGLAPILIAPPHTSVQQRLVLWNKAKPVLLTYREETKQPWCPIADLPAPWVLSSAGKLIRYLHGSYFLPYRTPDASGAARQNTIELIIISDAVYSWCLAVTRQIPDSKLLPRSIYDVLTQISNDFQRSLCRVQCRPTATGHVYRTRCPVASGVDTV